MAGFTLITNLYMKSSEILLHGPNGRIQARLDLVEKHENTYPSIALLLHSHSSLGGSMKDPIVHILKHALVQNGYSVLSINCKGGESIQNQSKTVKQEDSEALEDAASSLDWLEKTLPSAKCICVAGFSFGSWIAMELTMRRPEVSHFISVSPPVEKYDFAPFVRFPLRGLVIQGEIDSVTEEKEVREFFRPMFDKKDSTVQYTSIEGGDHFLRGKRKELEKVTDAYLKSAIDELQENHNKVKKAKYTRNKAPVA
jgi:alpha/beta superfamily hydrolase